MGIKVYIVFIWTEATIDEMVGVFSTRDAAKKKIIEYGERYTRYLIEEWEVEG